MANLPRELIVDILSRLPVKSLCRFKCVSKPWRSLISDPDFVKTHLHRAEFKRLILASPNSHYSIDHETPFENDVVAVQLDVPLKQIIEDPQPHWSGIIGSSNGLVCIMPQPNTFFALNPATHESARIPDFITRPDLDPNEIHSYGFGYASSIDDYKLVKAAHGNHVAVFSFRTGAWKLVEGFHYEEPGDIFLPLPPATPLNGSIHWAFNLRDGGAFVVAAFDLVKETFRDFPVPEPAVAGFSIGVLREKLCLMHCADGQWRRYFWVMKEYGVKESWTKIFVVEPCFVLRPLCLWKNCKILMVRDGKELVLCNPKDGTCKNFEVDGIPDSFYADVYVESLVSPNFQ
jgi:F-box interacting protein|uniref:F-box domain-containing protein n=1 Tax=Fagus sylvatica TaxID=28930 RepID=A0A2N9EM60_FAGSY